MIIRQRFVHIIFADMCGIFLCACGAHNASDSIAHRGPDGRLSLEIKYNMPVVLKFYHLSINSDDAFLASQPIMKHGLWLLANAEIYNYKQFKYNAFTKSDCEVILDLYTMGGIERVCDEIDGEFAFAIYDPSENTVYAARDPYGVRPLFISGTCLSSEAKGFGKDIHAKPFLPGHYAKIDLITRTVTYKKFERRIISPEPVIYGSNEKLRDIVIRSVEKRLMGEAPIGCFLSGGLDSSIVVAIAATRVPNLRTFTIGMKGSSDVAAAKFLAEKLGISANHRVYEFTAEQGIAAIPAVVKQLETYDVTTVRASIPQYLLSQFIASEGVKCLLSGEGSDELFGGYQYFKNAPSDAALAEESDRLLEELYLFDNLRTDRTTSAWGLEVRVPFLDAELVDYVRKSDPALRKASPVEKQWLRQSFEGMLPNEILWRAKEAFSDAVSSKGRTWKQSLNEFVSELGDLDEKLGPTAEAQYYRSIYNQFYESDLIGHYWMPKWIKQEKWDPSATTIDCYKKDENF